MRYHCAPTWKPDRELLDYSQSGGTSAAATGQCSPISGFELLPQSLIRNPRRTTIVVPPPPVTELSGAPAKLGLRCSGHANLAASRANMPWSNGLRDFCDRKNALASINTSSP